MRPGQIEEEMKSYLPTDADISDYIPIQDGEKVIGVVAQKDIDYLSNASWGGAWIGQERELGGVLWEGQKLKVVSDGDYEYAY